MVNAGRNEVTVWVGETKIDMAHREGEFRGGRAERRAAIREVLVNEEAANWEPRMVGPADVGALIAPAIRMDGQGGKKGGDTPKEG